MQKLCTLFRAIIMFPLRFIFYYDSVAAGYKMVGNAVPVKLAEAVASKIKEDLV